MKRIWIEFFTWFVKLTGWPVQFFWFKTKVYKESDAQGCHLHGPAILVSNHRSVYDFALYLFLFPLNTVRYLMGEALFRNKLLGWFLRSLGGIRIDRSEHSVDGVERCRRILEKGGTVGIFPEGRCPLPEEARPLPFHDGAAVLGLSTGAAMVPVVTDGVYFQKARAHVLIGTPLCAADYVREGMTEREAEKAVTAALRAEIIRLEALLNEKKQNEA